MRREDETASDIAERAGGEDRQGYPPGDTQTLLGRREDPDRVWNKIPDAVRDRVVKLALDQPELSPRELAVRFNDVERYSSRNHRSIAF
jgi:hypothetical protein